MTLVTPISEFFTAGGTLPPDAPSYVKRPTDEELYQKVRAGEFCYVLTPRQMGKSSLMIRTARRLMEEGVKSAIVDLTQIGTVESEDQWYKGILSQIRRRLRMSLDPVTWWEQKRDIPNIQKFIEFFEAALVEIQEHVVIFMDEIDTTLKLDFRDNFFAGIRAIYNGRAENSDLGRVTFVLLGVASPSDLIKDRSRTPFNIGQEISLKPFSREDARMLEQGLEAAYPGQAQRILNRVFDWTNGHPYLTQKVCQCVVDNPLPEYDNDRIDSLVESLFISEEASRETNLQFVRDTILYYPDRKEILSLYKKVLNGKEVRDNKNSVTQNHLKLAGLVRVEDGRLVVSNNIYARVFDLAWVSRYTEVNWSSRLSVVLGVIVFVLVAVILYDAMYLPNKSQQASDDVTMYNDDRGIHALAELFGLRPLLLPNEYEYKAQDLFFNQLSRDDQIALIEINPYTEMRPSDRPEFKEDYKAVVKGLYISLADVDRTGQSTELLEKMKTSLEALHLQEDSLYKEIFSWLEARKLAEGGKWNKAAVLYTAAIKENPSNPATQFERARVYARENTSYADALKDYDSVLGIVPKSDIEPTAGPTPATVTNVLETQAAANPNSAVSPTTALTPASPGPATESTTVIATPVQANPQETVEQVVETLPFQSRFMTRGQRIAAVKNDMLQNSALYAFYIQGGSASYPNLVESIPQQTETPAPEIANPRQTLSITPLGKLAPGSTITHQVTQGEWLEQIARCYGADLSAVQRANPKIPDPKEDLTVSSVVVPNIGSAGTIYGPPCVVYYTVEAGDTLASIAIQFNASVEALISANPEYQMPGFEFSPGIPIRVPVNSGRSGTSGGTPAAGTPVTQALACFIGDWQPTNPNGGMSRLTVEQIDQGTYTFHGWGDCTPEDCDWGVIEVPASSPRLIGTYQFSFKSTRVTLECLPGGQLNAELFDDYTASDGRTDRTTIYTLSPFQVVISATGTTAAPIATESGATGLAAPRQLSPANGSVFDFYPRTTTLEWSPVPGAVTYSVEIDCFHCCKVNQWCTDVGQTFRVVTGIEKTSYVFDYVGAQPGRWRVWVVGANRNEGPKSNWWEFTYTR